MVDRFRRGRDTASPLVNGSKVTSDALVRVLAMVFEYGRGLVFIPIIARGLGQEAYGLWGQMMATLTFLGPLLSLNLSASYLRYMPSKKDADDISSMLFSGLMLVWSTTTLFAVVAWLFRDHVALIMFGSRQFAGYASLFLLLLLVRCSVGFVRRYYHSRNRIRTFSALEIAQIAVEMGLAVALVTQTHLGLAGVLWALILVEALFAVGIVLAVLWEVGLPQRLSLRRLRPFLMFSLPLIPNSMLMWVVSLSDRYVITHMLGLEQTAIYVGAYQIGRIVQMFMGPISFGFRPSASGLWDRGKKAELRTYIEQALRVYAFFMIPSLLGLYHLGPSLLKELAGIEYGGTSILLALIALGVGSASANQVSSYPIALTNKTWLFLLLSIAAGSFNLGFNIWLVPKWGIMAAAVSTLLTYWARNAILTVIAYRILPFRVDRRFLLKAIFSSAVMFTAIRWIPPGGLGSTLGVAGIGAVTYILSMTILRGLTRRDWGLLIAAARAAFYRTTRERTRTNADG